MSRGFIARSCNERSRPTANSEWTGWLAVLAFIGAVATGCGVSESPVAHLQGSVTVNGNPIPEDATAYINFAPAKGNNSESVSVKVIGGKYDSPKTPRGPVLVSFDMTHPVGPEKKSERTGQMYQEVVSLVPPQYATGIQIDVQGDDPNHDFHL